MTSQELFSDAWRIAVDRLPRGGRVGTLTATPDECASVASALGIRACDRLTLDYRLVPHGRNRAQLTGQVIATISQSCVVSLEPVAQDIAAPVKVQFEPEIVVPATDEQELDPDALDTEALVDGRCDLGQVAYEILAIEMDPYPRASDADEGWEGETIAADERQSPFAALQKLRESGNDDG